MEKYLRQLITIEFEDKKEIFSGFLIDWTEDWIFRCKGRHDSATKCTTIPLQSTPPIPLQSTPIIPLQRSPLIPEQSTPLFS